MLVAHIGGLEGIGLRLHLEDQIDDVLERQIMGVWAMPAGERVVDGVDAPPGELAIGLDRGFWLQHVPPVGQARIVDLQDEAGRHHRAVLLAQRVGQREQEFVIGLVVFVENEVVEPAGRQDWDERLLRFGPLRSDRAAGDDPHRDRRHRLLARDQEQGSGPVAIGIEIGEFVALAGRVAGDLGASLLARLAGDRRKREVFIGLAHSKIKSRYGVEIEVLGRRTDNGSSLGALSLAPGIPQNVGRRRNQLPQPRCGQHNRPSLRKSTVISHPVSRPCCRTRLLCTASHSRSVPQRSAT